MRDGSITPFEAGLHSVRSGLSRWPPLLLVVVALGVATGLRLLLDPVWGFKFPFLLFFPAVLICAIGAGWRYGVLAMTGAMILAVTDPPDAAGYLAPGCAHRLPGGERGDDRAGRFGTSRPFASRAQGRARARK